MNVSGTFGVKALISENGKYRVWAELVQPACKNTPVHLRFSTTYVETADPNEDGRMEFELALTPEQRQNLKNLL